MIKVKEWLKDLKYLVTNRVTHYDNSFPGNCGEINPDGSISFDCIGMEKSVLNEPGIVYKTSPAGYYVKPGQVVPDGYGSLDLLNSCSGIGWHNFKGIVPGEHLYMEFQGHGGVYVGDLFGKNSKVNVIECCSCWNVEGVVASWIDLDTGARRSMKGGLQVGTWDAHGKLTKFIDYSEKKKEKSIFKDVPLTDPHYKVYKKLVEEGILSVDKEGNFHPDKDIKKKHLAIIAYRIMQKAKLI